MLPSKVRVKAPYPSGLPEIAAVAHLEFLGSYILYGHCFMLGVWTTCPQTPKRRREAAALLAWALLGHRICRVSLAIYMQGEKSAVDL